MILEKIFLNTKERVLRAYIILLLKHDRHFKTVVKWRPAEAECFLSRVLLNAPGAFFFFRLYGATLLLYFPCISDNKVLPSVREISHTPYLEQHSDPLSSGNPKWPEKRDNNRHNDKTLR